MACDVRPGQDAAAGSLERSSGYAPQMPPRILHLSTYTNGGGAARAAMGVNAALQKIGVDSKVISARGSRFALAKAADRALWRLQHSPRRTWRSPALFGSLSAADINSSSADVVNLHWVTDGFLSIEEIGKITKPLVMSMYDMWPFCGTEHYGVDTPDARWRTGYRRDNRPSDESGMDIDLHTWKRKAQRWSGIHMVPASTWLERATRESALCCTWPVTRIPHPVDETVFHARDKSTARLRIGIDPERPTIGFLASAGIGDLRKGFDLLMDAMGGVRREFPQVQIMVVGPESAPGATPAHASVHFVGSVDSDADLSAAYEACDVLAVPSREDNMPLTAMEAQISGRPVVGYSIGGLPDIVDHQITGYLASPWDCNDLATGLQLALGDSLSRGSWGANAREHGIRTWSYAHVANRYLELYEQVQS